MEKKWHKKEGERDRERGIRHLDRVKRNPSQQRQGFRPLGRGGFLELAVPTKPE